MKKTFTSIGVLTLLFVFSAALSAQARRPQRPETESSVVISLTSTPTPEPKSADPHKRNERPTTESAVPTSRSNSAAATHFYEFARPGFSYSKILIEHDDTGKGTISFLKDGFDEMIIDPINLSPVTLAKIDEALAELKFLDSTEDYQFARDFSHLGNSTFRLKRDGRERTAKYNWTENKSAKSLTDEYRRIGHEYTWRFEISVARENQPLQTPGLMNAIDSYLRRGEISDPVYLLPFLTELSTDERLPLIARNHAAKLIKKIEKEKK